MQDFLFSCPVARNATGLAPGLTGPEARGASGAEVAQDPDSLDGPLTEEDR